MKIGHMDKSIVFVMVLLLSPLFLHFDIYGQSDPTSEDLELQMTPIQVQGTDLEITYAMSEGAIKHVFSDKESTSLIMQLDSVSDGTLTISLPREVIDAKDGEYDTNFWIIIDGFDILFNEKRSENERTITFDYSKGSEELVIIGTSVASESDPVSIDIPLKSIQVQGTDLEIAYSMSEGVIKQVLPDQERKSLVIQIESNKGGTLEIELPRDVIDAKVGENDSDFFVIVDEVDILFDETKTEDDRTITLDYPGGPQELIIIGTSVIPEFGTIAILIFISSIFSIIFISKSRLVFYLKF